MPSIFGQLKKADLENLPSEPSNPSLGRVYWDTTLECARVYNGSVWKDLSPGPVSEVVVHTGNGRGSVNTRVRRFSTVLTNTGSDITYADDADAGASFTINTKGLYFIQYEDKSASSLAYFGPSKNSAQLTTDVHSISIADRLGLSRFELGSYNGGPSCALVPLDVNDVIRPHCNTACDSTTNQVYFRIIRVA